MEKGKVALIIPCYNAAKFLPACFGYVFSQTYSSVEIYFVDDGSQDDSAKIAREWMPKFEDKGYKFNYLYQTNAGAAAAIQNALGRVDAEYIMLYDTDDALTEDSIQLKAEFLNKHRQYDMVRSNGYYSQDKPDNIIGVFSNNEKEKRKEHIFTDLLKAETVNWPASYMIRSEALFKRLKDRKIYISRFGQNLQLMLPVAYFGLSGYIDKPLMQYVIRKDSDSNCGTYEKKLKMTDGYTQNRIEVTKSLDIPEEQKTEFCEMALRAGEARKLELAYECGEKQKYFEEYKRLKAENKISCKQARIYRERRYKIVKFFMRVWRKVCGVLCQR